MLLVGWSLQLVMANSDHQHQGHSFPINPSRTQTHGSTQMMQTIVARKFALSGQHDHLATLASGLHFHGLYTLRQRPTVATVQGELCYSLWVEDLTGRLQCTIPVWKTAWQEDGNFKSQHLLIKAYAVGDGSRLVGRINSMEPVHVVWD
jgi:hypothetical protein